MLLYAMMDVCERKYVVLVCTEICNDGDDMCEQLVFHMPRYLCKYINMKL